MEIEKIKGVVKGLLRRSIENDVDPMTLGCFNDIGCNIQICRSEDYNLIKETGQCCKYYEFKCKLILDSVMGNTVKKKDVLYR